jgi:hypothetical protein
LKSTKQNCTTAAALTLLALLSIPATAEGVYYRWVDDTGITVNSDRPPPKGIAYETITTSTNLRQATDTAEEEPETAAQALPALTGDQPSSPAPVARMEVIKSPEACTAARQNLETLSTHARIRKPDAQGNYRYLSEDEKAEERAQAEKTIAQNCE